MRIMNLLHDHSLQVRSRAIVLGVITTAVCIKPLGIVQTLGLSRVIVKVVIPVANLKVIIREVVMFD